MRAVADIVSALKVIHRFLPQFHTLFKTAECESLMLFIKTIGPAQQPTWCKRPTLLIVASVEEGLFREIFISDIIVDDRDGTLCSYVIVVINDIIF